jgi:beta-phosphoglucomutase
VSTTHRAILWDLDGTIVDTKACHLFTWKIALEMHGYEFDLTLLTENFGRNNTTLLPLLLGFEPDHDLMMKIIDKKESLFRKIAADWISLVPGVTSWLSAAADLNFSQAIASSAPMENIVTMLGIFNLESCFNKIVSGTNMPAKPQPDVFLHAADVLNVSPENCLVIEDSVAGVQGARKAGMRCIAVGTTHHQEDMHQADVVIEDFTVPFPEMLQTLFWD